MVRQSCGGNPVRRQSCGGDLARQASKRTAAQVPTKAASEPKAKQARKQVPTKGQAEEVLSPPLLAFLKKNGVSKASFEPVLEAVRHVHSGFPKSVRDTLLATLPWSLAVPADKRHESQKDVVLMVDGVFGNVQAELQRVVDKETIKVDELRARQAELVDTAERAEAASDVARNLVEEQEKALADGSSSLLQARKALLIAEREEARFGAELAQTRSLMVELEETMSGSFRRLKVAEFEDGAVDSLVQAVMAAGAKSGLEEALVTTLPICLAKRERGVFDQTVIGEAEQRIQGKIAALGEVVEATAGSMETQAEAVREATATLNAAVAAQAQAADSVCRAQAERAEAAGRTGAAKVAAAEFGSNLAPALEVQRAGQGELDHFCCYNTFLFELLRDRNTEKESVGALAGGVLPPASSGGA